MPVPTIGCKDPIEQLSSWAMNLREVAATVAGEPQRVPPMLTSVEPAGLRVPHITTGAGTDP